MTHRCTVSVSRRRAPLMESPDCPLSTRPFLRCLRRSGPLFVPLLLAGIAHAQGTMDFSGAQTLMGTFKTFAIYAGAVICFGGLIFAGIQMMSGRLADAIPGLFGALFGAGVLGWARAGLAHSPGSRCRGD